MAQGTAVRQGKGTVVIDRTTDVAVVPLDRIHLGSNVRDNLDGVKELAESIRKHGVLTAVLVTRRDDDDYDLDAGYRRVAAATKAGLTTIPAVVRDPVTALQRLDDQLAENDDRLGLSDLDKAGAAQQMLDLGASPKEVARRFQCSTDELDTWRGIVSLPAAIRERIRDGLLSADDAAQLVPLMAEAEILAGVLEEIEDGSAPGYAIRRVRAQYDTQQREKAAREKLVAEDCKIVDPPQWGVVSTNSKMQRLGDGVKIGLRQHRKLPCHAAFIDRNGKSVYVCTNRSVHAGEKDSGVPDLKALRAQKKAEREALKEAHVNRKAALQPILEGVLPDDVLMTRHLLHLSIEDADHRMRSSVSEQLGLGKEGDVWHDDARLLNDYIGEDDQKLRQVALLIAVTRGEHSFTEEKGRFETGYIASAHLAFVAQAVGYEPTPVERERAAVRGLSAWSAPLPSFLGGATDHPSEETVEGNQA